MKQWLGILCITLLSITHVQAQGIKFEEGTWAEVVAKAKQANKLIYMDVYASWCGPCKMMARDVFPHPEAGKKYNELFINFKIDAEKGEGRAVAAKYAVSSYPTNLYIDPKTEEVVYRVAGACDVPEFLRRADIAQNDFTDPMSWDDYNAQLKKNPKDLEFLQKYIEKGGRTGNYTDAAIDVYVKHYLKEPVSDSNLMFLINYTMTVDNEGYKVLLNHKERANQFIQDPRFKIEEREKNHWLQNTFKKALAMKDVNVLKRIKPIIYKFNPHDTLGVWYNVEKQFYQAIKDEANMTKSITNSAQYYYKLSNKTIKENDKAMLADNMKNLTNELKAKNTTEENIKAQIQHQANSNPQFANGFTTNATNVMNTAALELFAKSNTSNKDLKSALNWTAKAMEINEMGSANWYKSLENHLNLLVKMGEQSKASKMLQQYIDSFQKENKDLKTLQTLQNKINQTVSTGK